MFASLDKCFDLSDGITFDDTCGIIYGTQDPASLVGSFPSGTLYIRTQPPGLWQLTDSGWASFGTSSVPQNVLDVTQRLSDVYVDATTGVLCDGNNLARYETVVSWCGEYVEDGDTMPVAYNNSGGAGHLVHGRVTHIAIHGGIVSDGDVILYDDSGDILTIAVTGDTTTHTPQSPVQVNGVLGIKLGNGIEADSLFIDVHYRRSL